MAISNLFNLFGRTALVTDSSRYLSKAIACTDLDVDMLRPELQDYGAIVDWL